MDTSFFGLVVAMRSMPDPQLDQLVRLVLTALLAPLVQMVLQVRLVLLALSARLVQLVPQVLRVPRLFPLGQFHSGHLTSPQPIGLFAMVQRFLGLLMRHSSRSSVRSMAPAMASILSICRTSRVKPRLVWMQRKLSLLR
jgi:hypothetical protein